MVIISMVKDIWAAAVVAAFALGIGGLANAATLDVASVTGTWTGLQPPAVQPM